MVRLPGHDDSFGLTLLHQLYVTLDQYQLIVGMVHDGQIHVSVKIASVVIEELARTGMSLQYRDAGRGLGVRALVYLAATRSCGLDVSHV
jgi:hypothetical protein